MVAIVGGARLGLDLGSLATLGTAVQSGKAVEGRNGQGVYVDVANGNLVLQRQDDVLVERGADMLSLRTYNSQGTFDDDNGDNWRNAMESVRLAGAVNTVGSSMQRVGRDGSVASYAYDATQGLYLSTEGAGAYDTLRYVAAEGQFEWRDGDTGLIQRFEGSGAGRLLSTRDPDGNTLTCAYSVAMVGMPSQLSSVTASNGDVTYYDYAGPNLWQVRTVCGGVVSTRVHYAYDASNRLSMVSVDLSPADNNTADGNAYQTTYAYDGASKRISRITQTDGSSLSIAYIDLGNGVFAVSSIADALNQTTRYAYGLSAPGVVSTALITDPVGTTLRYDFDAKGQVTAITAPSVNGVAAVRQFTYTANGDIASITDGEGRTTVFQYDANGNQVLRRDAAGNTVTRTFDARNQLLSETAYTVPDPDAAGAAQPSGALTTRYVYDAAGHDQLRFVVTADGRVTEHRYNAYGERVSTIVYAGGTDQAAVAASAIAPTEADLVTWTTQSMPMGNLRTDMTYDPRRNGQLWMRTTYASVGPNGDGIADGSQSVERFLYDQAGLLLQSFSPGGAVTTYSHDGLGRVTLMLDALGQSTVTRYSDSGSQTAVQHANGLLTTSSYDLAGRLVSVMDSTSAGPATTRYVYDADDRLRMTQDPTGVRTWKLYDEDGRLAADIDGTGTMTEYSYDRSDLVVRSMTWGTAVNTALLVDASGAPVTTVTAAGIRPPASASDAATWNQYDAAGRLLRQAKSVGTGMQAAVTETRYDGASRVLQVVQYANPVAADGSAAAVAPGKVPLPPLSAQDRLTRNFYDGEGHLTGTLDAEGFLVTYGYNPAGLMTSQRAYFNAVAPALRSADTLALLLPPTSTNDITQSTLYDGKGQVVGRVDGENYLTENVYDVDGNLTRSIRYANRVSVVGQSTIGAIRPPPSPYDRVTTRSYDLLHRLVQETDPEGVVTQSAYDNMGHLVSTVRAAGTGEARSLLARYDLQGRLTGELSPIGAALLTGGQTQAQVDAIWGQYATTYTYDGASRRTSMRDALGNTTWFWYDADGALRYTVNALGEVHENRYDARGRLLQEIAYVNRVAPGGPGGLLSAPLVLAPTSLQDSVTSYTYTTDGEVASITDAEGNLSTRSYNAFGDEVTQSEALAPGQNRVQNFTVDHRGLRTAAVSDPAGINAVVSTAYDAFGRATQTVDANGNMRDHIYDHVGRVIVERDPTAAVRRTSYDAFGRQLTQTDALGNTTVYAYDNLTRSITVTTPEGVRTTTVRNRHGQVQSVTDGKGQVTAYTYDASGKLLRTTTPLATGTASAYDAAGRVIETTDANGNKVAYSYDAANRVLTRRVDPTGLNLTTTYQYDGKGQQVGVTDPNGVTTTFQYDRKGRVLVRTVDPGGLNLATTYRYDAKGDVLSLTAPSGATTQYTFDALGRRTQESRLVSGLLVTRSWAYDRNGNAVACTDGTGAITRYAYDGDDRLVYTVDPAGGVRQLVYDAEGRVVQSVAYATPVSMVAWTGAITPADVQGRVVAQPAQDEVEYSRYDRDGRRIATMDGTGGMVRYTYDANGNVVSRTAYANRITLPEWNMAGLVGPPADPAHDERQQTVYDALNRALYTMDGTGAVVAQKYDANGNVVERTAYATPVSPATAMTQSAMTAALALVANPARDLDVRNTYDAANRLVWTADGTGAVSRRVYDRDGNVIQQVAYATAIPSGAPVTSVPASVNDRVISRAYDNAGRMVFEIDPLNVVTERVFDGEGRVKQQTTYANALSTLPPLGASTTVAAIRSALRPSAGDRTTWHGFDAAGREVATLSADGSLTETTFDAAGRITATVAHANRVPIPPPSGLTGDQLRSLALASAADRRTTFFYDPAGRLLSQADALGGVTQMQYDAIGRVVRVIRPAAHIETTQYDAAGRRIGTTDAINQAESYTYDGAGRELTFTNKKRATWTYDHDAAGRTIRETSPAVNLSAAALVNGSVSVTATPWVSVVTLTGYDALGNVTQRTEAAGRSGEERTTRYEYDAAGRQVHVIFAPVGVYNPATDAPTVNGASGLASRSDSTRSLETRTYYDALGNAVANRDLGGALSQKVYDRAGRVTSEIDALGFVTGYVRNAFGEETALTRNASGTNLALRSVTQAGQAATSADVATALGALSHAADRTVQTSYDTMGRVVERRQPVAFVYDSTSGAGLGAAARTRTIYDAFGEARQVSTARDATGTSWFTTIHYFDALGRETASVDAMGYVTRRAYDAVGNLVQLAEYATALASGSWSATVLPSPLTAADDRTTQYAYDVLDRKVSETRVNVEFSSDASGTSTRGNLVTRYGYDALGNQTSVQDALGNTTYTCYDALGRVSALFKPAGNGANAITEYRRDANGNIVLQVEHAAGVYYAPPPSGDFTPLPDDLANDQRTLTHYDALGRATETTDANGATAYASFDAYGHVAKSWQAVTDNDGATRTAFQVNVYDAVGHLVETRTPASTTQVQGGLTASYTAGTPVMLPAFSGTLATPNTMTLGWSTLVDPAAGTVRVEIDYISSPTQVRDADGTPISGTPSQMLSVTQDYTAAAAAGGATLTWWVPTDIVTAIRVRQVVGGQWVSRWEGSLANANGSGVNLLTQAQAGLVYTDQEYNAFGEITRRGTQGGRQEYFDYDAAGRLWRTNTGDGVDVVRLHDLQGNVTSEIRSSGTGGDNADLKVYATPDAAAANPNTRREDIQYDALGHVTKRTEAARADVLGGVTVQRQYVGTAVQSATPIGWDDFHTVFTWSGTNKVTLTWNNLAALGSGDLRVTVNYRTPLIQNGGDSDMGSTTPIYYTGGTARTFTSGVLVGDTNATSTTLAWAETATSVETGGVGEVTWVKVEKKDINGAWATVIDQVPGYGANEVDVAAPADTASAVRLDLRKAGTTTWEAVLLANFGNGYRYDARGRTAGTYEYRVAVTPPGQLEAIVDTGTLAITQPPLNAITTAILYGIGPAGMLAWLAPPIGTQQAFRYRVAGSGSTWTERTITTFNKLLSVAFMYSGVDTSTLAGGTYEFELVWGSSGVPTSHATGSFTVGTQYGVTVNTVPGSTAISTTDGASLSESAGLNGFNRAMRPVVQQVNDRWGNVLQVTDPRSAAWVTTYRYNANDQVVTQTQPDATGAGAPVSSIYYDALGRQVAVRDALSHVNGQVFDAAGHLVKEAHADAKAITYAYDIFGRKVQSTDANGNLVTFGYDKLDHLMSMTKGAAQVYAVSALTNQVLVPVTRPVVETWSYDQLGRKLWSTNGNGERLRYSYDLRGNVTQTQQPGLQLTRDAFDAQGRKIAEVDANAYATSWTYDYFGQLTGHTDIGGARYTYTYDNARQLLAQVNTRNQNLAYAYDAAGQVVAITDRANNQVTSYAYDAAGRHVRERVTQAGITYQDNHLAFDATGNLRDVADARVHITMQYDKAGNRTFIGTSVDYQGTTGETKSTAARYFQYDAMNRQTVVDAVDAAGNIGQQGHILAFDGNGNRTSDTYWGNRLSPADPNQRIVGYDSQSGALYAVTTTYGMTQGLTTEQYRYDALNRLLDVQRDGTQIDLRWYDGADRVIHSGPRNLPSGYNAGLLNSGVSPSQSNGTEIRTNRYDANGRLLHQRIQNADTTEKANISWDSNEAMAGRTDFRAAGYDAVGNALGYTVMDGASDALTKYTTTLKRYEAHQAGVTSAVSTATGPGTGTQDYDSNGFLIRFTDSVQSVNNRTFINDASGRALYVNQAGWTQRQLIANGEVLGTYGVGVNPLQPTLSNGNANFANLVDFNFTYAPITARYPSASPGAYQVRTGDTLQSLAKSAYGDSDLWFRIAEANGLAGNNDLKVGQTLNIPNAATTIHNNGGTFKPYDPTRLSGDMTPTLPMPGNGDGCGGFGKLLMVVVAVAVSFYTAGVLSPEMSTLQSAALAEYDTVGVGEITGLGANVMASGSLSVPVGMAAGAAASGASQVVGVATGAIQDFSWKDVALSAISGGVSAGVPRDAFGAGLPGHILRSAVATAATQGIGVVVGLQNRFDWQAVAAAGAGTASDDVVAAGMNDVPSAFIRRAASGLAAGAVTAIAQGGRVNVQQVAIDAFGNALGQSLAAQFVTSAEGAVTGLSQIDKVAFSYGVRLISQLATGGDWGAGFTDTVALASGSGWESDGSMFRQGARDLAIGAGVVTGMFEGLGTTLISTGALAKDLLLAQQYILAGGDNRVNRSMLPGFELKQEAYRNVQALGATVREVVADPRRYLGDAIGSSYDNVAKTLVQAQLSENLSDWFLYGAAVGNATFGVAGAFAGVTGSARFLAGGARELNMLLRARVDALAPEVGMNPLPPEPSRGVSGLNVPRPAHVRVNQFDGGAWERDIVETLLPNTQRDIRTQISVKSNGPSGLRVRLDALGTDVSDGQLKMTDGKNSATAPLTVNQAIVYPELELFGGVVVGKGKAPYIGGTQIPPTSVDIIRRKQP